MPTLECISITADCSNHPCGEIDPDAPEPDLDADPPVPAKYCKNVVTHHGDGEGDTTKTYSLDDDGNCTSTCSGSWTHRNGQKSAAHTWEEAGTTTTLTCTASESTVTYSYDGSASCTPTEEVDDTPHSSGSGSSVSVGESGVSTCTDGVMTTTVTSGGSSFTITRDVDECGCSGATPVEITPDTKTYTECEEVPECDLTFPDWPEWESDTPDDPPPELEEGQGHESTAIRDWSPGGATKTETKVKWRIRHSPTGTCYLKVWLRKTTTVTGDPDADPPVEDTVTTDDSETYQWEGTGNPCIENPDDGASDPSNDIVGEENDLDPPDENGSITIEILKFSCLRDYEPDVTDEENPQPNGYPDPAWEAEAP